MTDFVGWLPMPSGGDARGRTHRRLQRRDARAAGAATDGCATARSSSATPTTSSTPRSAPACPTIGEWTRANYDFAGYVTGFVPPSEARARRGAGAAGLRPRRPAVRRDRWRLGRRGRAAASGDGRDSARAAPACPELKFLVVTGPRIDPAILPRRRGATVRGFVRDLYLVPGGLRRRGRAGRTDHLHGTRGRPASVHLRAARESLRAELPRPAPARRRYGAGRCMRYAEASDPTTLAAAIAEEVSREVQYRSVETDGAARAATLLAELI